ncbi:MAG: transcription-repair coupling factor, partial [Proteobacteria bacterium]|nr:transcription-repair coupling factor [Pseudomonadota bacterium]
ARDETREQTVEIDVLADAQLEQIVLHALRCRRAFLTAYLAPEAAVVLDEPSRLKLRLDEMTLEAGGSVEGGGWRSKEAEVSGVWADALALLGDHRRIELQSWGATEEQVDLFLPTEGVPGFSSRIDDFAAYALDLAAKGETVAVVTHQAARLRHIVQRADELGRLSDEARPGRVCVMGGQLLEGFRLEGQLTLVTDREILGVARRQRFATPSERGSTLRLEDLSVGDAVVHVSHGIGRFEGLKTLQILGSSRDFLELSYLRGDRVFVPVEQMQNVSKYVGLDGGGSPSLSKLGGAEWQKTRQRVATQIKDMADQLLQLYAERKAHPGHGFSPDGVWMDDLEAAFPYDETPDQEKAIAAVKADMESELPMDRLVCGDVGFGKTEVAVRAAFKAVLDNRQVAVLVPTTVLAQQHGRTFAERLEPFPVKVGVLSRFRTPREQRETVKAVNAGEVDVIVGTHRLLQKDVKFSNLGLVIIDEEQHFGVEHKERLKELRAQVDVITLTATPIPRTLQMSLAGVRDLSLIETPPEARLPIKTYLFETAPEVVRGAITRELDRGGQVFFVYNRVRGIEKMAAELRDLVPQARIAVGHGQMSEGQLEHVIGEFVTGAYDILLCTTIIESGIDMPNVNTIVVYDAHRFGLGQLYQLRGRVGRSPTQAYCYLLYPPHKSLSREAELRLETIRDFTALGSGYQIALRDLEIRGAGNLLGAEQSGQIASVGFSLYCQMLEEAVAQAKGRKPRGLEAPTPVMELPVEAFLPDGYVPDAKQKITLYRRLAEATEAGQVDGIAAEMRDRFGALPTAAENLVRFVHLKLEAVALGVPSIKFRDSFGDRAVVLLVPFVTALDRRQLTQLGSAAGCRAAYANHQLVLSGFRTVDVDWVDAVRRALAWMKASLPR